MDLNQVLITVNNMELSVAFYQTLGLRIIVSEPHYARFECPAGNTTLSLYLGDAESQNNSVIYFEHQQLDALVTQLKQKGLSFVHEPEDKSYLWREAMLHDPSGNEIKLFWAGENRKYPPWRVNA